MATYLTIYPRDHTKDKHMYRLTLQLLTTIVLLLMLAPSKSPAAQDPDDLSAVETKDKWGQLIFCQKIYKMPEVKSRLYDFDVEQCDKASELVADVISKYSKRDQETLKNQAEQHAYKLSYNTTEPYHAVGACRDYCSKLAKIKDQRDD